MVPKTAQHTTITCNRKRKILLVDPLAPAGLQPTFYSLQYCNYRYFLSTKSFNFIVTINDILRGKLGGPSSTRHGHKRRRQERKCCLLWREQNKINKDVAHHEEDHRAGRHEPETSTPRRHVRLSFPGNRVDSERIHRSLEFRPWLFLLVDVSQVPFPRDYGLMTLPKFQESRRCSIDREKL